MIASLKQHYMMITRQNNNYHYGVKDLAYLSKGL